MQTLFYCSHINKGKFFCTQSSFQHQLKLKIICFISVPNIVSPGGTVLTDDPTPPFQSLLDEAPLSPELLNTVDPSAVTQSFKYPVSNTPVIVARQVCVFSVR